MFSLNKSCVLLYFETLRPKQSLVGCFHRSGSNTCSGCCKKETKFLVLHITKSTVFLHWKFIRVVVGWVVIVFGELIIFGVPQCWGACCSFIIWSYFVLKKTFLSLQKQKALIFPCYGLTARFTNMRTLNFKTHAMICQSRDWRFVCFTAINHNYWDNWLTTKNTETDGVDRNAPITAFVCADFLTPLSQTSLFPKRSAALIDGSGIACRTGVIFFGRFSGERG